MLISSPSYTSVRVLDAWMWWRHNLQLDVGITLAGKTYNMFVLLVQLNFLVRRIGLQAVSSRQRTDD